MSSRSPIPDPRSLIVFAAILAPQFAGAAEDDRVWLDENTYYRADADQIAVDDEWRGAIRWRYVGPAVFHEDDVDVDAEIAASEDPFQLKATLSDAIWGMTRVDRQGRQWEVVDIDEREVERARRTYQAQVARDFDVPMSSVVGSSSRWDVPAVENCAGAQGNTCSAGFQELGWTSKLCDGSQNEPSTIWNDEGRLSWDEDLDTFDVLASVLLYEYASSAWRPICSGTFIDGKRNVLTAAHCVTNGATSKNEPDLMVCTRGNLDNGASCFPVADIAINGELERLHHVHSCSRLRRC